MQKEFIIIHSDKLLKKKEKKRKLEEKKKSSIINVSYTSDGEDDASSEIIVLKKRKTLVNLDSLIDKKDIKATVINFSDELFETIKPLINLIEKDNKKVFLTNEVLENMSKQNCIVDIDLMNESELKVDMKKNTVEKIGFEHCVIPIKKFTAKECDYCENSLQIKILETYHTDIRIGMVDFDFDFKSDKKLGLDSGFCFDLRHYEFLPEIFGDNNLDFKFEKKIEKNDVIEFQYNSKDGGIRILFNDLIVYSCWDVVSTKKDYRFVVSLKSLGDKIEIIE